MRSPIRWAGSKRGQLGVLRNQWKAGFKRYIEPFCGSCCHFFDVEPRKAVLGDLNAELIEMYRAIRSNVEEVINILKSMPTTKRDYYRIRRQDVTHMSREEQAARFLYLNRLCFNGIYRANLLGHFNVPYAKPKTRRWSFDFERIRKASEALQVARLESGDFEAIVGETKPGDYVFLDPPYVVSNRRVFVEYHACSFNSADLERFGMTLNRIDDSGATFVVSYADCSEARKLLSNWNVRRVRALRCVGGFESSRRFAYELIASNDPLNG